MLESLRYYVNNKRILIGLAVLTGLVVLIVVIAVVTSKSEKGFPDKFVDSISNKNIQENVKFFSKDPHPAGQKRNLELGAEILNRWKSYGFSDVFENDYEVLLSLPTEKSYIKYDDKIQYEPEHDDGSDPIPPFNAFSKNAKVTGNVVYVNYGTVQDFKKLVELGVDLENNIALCRYGQIFRGSKAQNAHDNKMVGMILYSDPSDTGSGKGKVYPDGQWLPDTGVQRGNVKTIKGDLSTYLYPSYAGGYHASESELEEISPKIPVIPIPYNDAKPIHNLILGVNAPKEWGDYKIGPSTKALELNVETNDTLSLCRNIIGVINGKEEPDRWVIIGFHRDAWINGAADPVSGMSTVLEISRSVAQMLKSGWQPRRTLIFASWDAEEPGIMGSFEFTEDYMTALKHKAVAYINMDTLVSQPDLLNMKSTPNLFELLYSSAQQTQSPDPRYKTMYDFWVGAEKLHKNQDYSFTKPPVNLIGSGSDYTAFLNEVGVSCIDFAYKTSYGSFPVYHTQYDTYEWLSTYGDPDFIYHQRIGQFAMRVLLSLVNEEILPMSAVAYATKVRELVINLIVKNYKDIVNLNVDIEGIKELSSQFLETAQKIDADIKQILPNVAKSDSIVLRNINDKLMSIDRQFIFEEGLPERPSFRHLLFAPSATDTYAGSTFPGIVDGMTKNDESSTKRQVGLIATKFEAAIRELNETMSFL